jgi:hypothetical protein
MLRLSKLTLTAKTHAVGVVDGSMQLHYFLRVPSPEAARISNPVELVKLSQPISEALNVL